MSGKGKAGRIVYDFGMSAARSLYPYPSLLGLTMTAEEYLALGETRERTELLNGVVTSTSPSPRSVSAIRIFALLT